MMDAIAAAASAVALVTPALIEVGKGSAKKVGETAADGVLGWLRTRTAGPSREALADLEAEPDNGANKTILELQLQKLLKRDPQLLSELCALLPSDAPAGNVQHQALGPGAKGNQVNGDGNTVWNG